MGLSSIQCSSVWIPSVCFFLLYDVKIMIAKDSRLPLLLLLRYLSVQVTYMLEGSFQHEDFCGHRGTINPGDLQWMTAGRGIVHAEMPSGDGDNVGLQLWINLRREDKASV